MKKQQFTWKIDDENVLHLDYKKATILIYFIDRSITIPLKEVMAFAPRRDGAIVLYFFREGRGRTIEFHMEDTPEIDEEVFKLTMAISQLFKRPKREPQ